jgi:hypothetical protein
MTDHNIPKPKRPTGFVPFVTTMTWDPIPPSVAPQVMPTPEALRNARAAQFNTTPAGPVPLSARYDLVQLMLEGGALVHTSKDPYTQDIATPTNKKV